MAPSVAEVLAQHPEEEQPERPFKPGSKLDPDIAAILADHPETEEDNSASEATDKEVAGKEETARVETGMLIVAMSSESGSSAARLWFTRPDGSPIRALPGLDWHWLDGVIRIRLPAGAYNLNASGGVRMAPHYGTVEILPGAVSHYRIDLREWAPVTQAGWMAGDPFVDVDSGTNTVYPDIESIGIAGRAEGLAFVGMQGAQTRLGPLGLPYSSMADGNARLVEALARASRDTFRPVLSRTGRLDGGARYYTIEAKPQPADATSEDATYFERLQAMREQGALLVLNRPAGILTPPDEGKTEYVAGELLFDAVAAHSFDAIDLGDDDEDRRIWQLLLNQGYQLSALSGGPSADATRNPDVPEVGCYIHSGDAIVSGEDVLRSIRDGRLVASNGPFVQLLIDGRRSGDTITPSSKPRTLFLEALSGVSRTDSLSRIELLYNGRVIKSWKGEKDQKSFQISLREVLPDVGWIAVRYVSTDRTQWAITNPVRITTPRFSAPPARAAQVELTLRSHRGKLPPQALVEIINYGSRVQTFPFGTQTIRFEAPATARLRISAAGYKTRELSIYRDGGPEGYISTLKHKGELRAALMDWKHYEHMRKILDHVKFDVTLKRSR